MELAIDTVSGNASIALSHKGEIVAELTWQSAKNHTVELTPNLARLLCQARIEPKYLEAIIVGKGPGSFNGLRVGMSIAKGMAFALHIVLLGISNLEAKAYPLAYTGLPLCPIHQVSRGGVAAALYQQKGNVWHCLREEQLSTVSALCQQLQQETLFCGEVSQEIANELEQNLGKRAIIARDSNNLGGASSLARLGWQRLGKGEYDDPVTLQPLYLRPPNITKSKRIYTRTTLR